MANLVEVPARAVGVGGSHQLQQLGFDLLPGRGQVYGCNPDDLILEVDALRKPVLHRRIKQDACRRAVRLRDMLLRLEVRI